MNHYDEIDHDEIAANDADQRNEQEAELDAERLRVAHLRAWATLKQLAEIAESCHQGFDVIGQALRHGNADDARGRSRHHRNPPLIGRRRCQHHSERPLRWTSGGISHPPHARDPPDGSRSST